MKDGFYFSWDLPNYWEESEKVSVLCQVVSINYLLKSKEGFYLKFLSYFLLFSVGIILFFNGSFVL